MVLIACLGLSACGSDSKNNEASAREACYEELGIPADSNIDPNDELIQEALQIAIENNLLGESCQNAVSTGAFDGLLMIDTNDEATEEADRVREGSNALEKPELLSAQMGGDAQTVTYLEVRFQDNSQRENYFWIDMSCVNNDNTASVAVPVGSTNGATTETTGVASIQTDILPTCSKFEVSMRALVIYEEASASSNRIVVTK